MATLADWNAAACEALGLDPAQTEAQQTLVLDLARDVARGVVRPAAPLSTYLLGIAVGRGADPAQAAADLTALVESWPSSPE
jgi:Domain of unknown function (DUF6457)